VRYHGEDDVDGTGSCTAFAWGAGVYEGQPGNIMSFVARFVSFTMFMYDCGSVPEPQVGG
jgi:hypothetical protein